MRTLFPKEKVAQLQKKIRYRFKKKHHLYEALCHKSFVFDGPKAKLKDNERMEFLGDSVLGMIITDELFRKLEDFQEGELSVIKSTLIRRETLAALAKKINLGEYLLLSKGEENCGGRDRDSILANAYESLMGGIYLDGGIRSIRKFILFQFDELLKRIPHDIHMKEYKNLLQELAHIQFKANPVYQIVTEKGPDHQKFFEAVVSINQEVYGTGTGPSKKEAEKMAAQAAYEKLFQSQPIKDIPTTL